MKYSMDFKPRVCFVASIDRIVEFCFYDYNKHHDIKCYDKNCEEIPEKTVIKTFDRYYNESDLTYTIKKEYEIGNEWDRYLNESDLTDTIKKEYEKGIWICHGWTDSKKMLHFIGYSEISPIHAIEDCENARKLILDRYFYRL
jgi:hypothetical protein